MSTETLKERLAKKKKELSAKGKKGKVLFLKEGTLRVRILNPGPEKEFAVEVTQFYLNQTIKGVYSPATLGKPCPIMEKYLELKESKKPEDKEFAKKLVPKKKYLIPVGVYKDTAGKGVDTEQTGKFIQVTSDLYNEIITYYLDEEWGDMTDVKTGYDFKLSRVGSGQFDTEYTAAPCKNTPAPKEFHKVVDIDAMLKEIIPSYEELEDTLAEFLSGTPADDSEEEDEKPVKKAPIILKKKIIIKKK